MPVALSAYLIGAGAVGGCSESLTSQEIPHSLVG